MVAVPSRGRADLQAHAPEADAVRTLYEQYGRQIYTFCFSRLRSREEAEDAVQSTFLNAFRALQRDVAPSHEAAWLYKIAENVCLTRSRSSVRRRRVETPGDLEAISEVVPAHEPDTEELANLPQALESMPEQQRRALLLREWQGLSYREIAEEMELSQSAVETLLFRARRTLAAGLVSDEPRSRGKLARLRAGGDAGAIASLLKTLLFSGGAKVVIAGAVAATGVVGISPGARHTIDDLFVPHMKAAVPAHHVVAAKPKPAHAAVTLPAPVIAAPPAVIHRAPASPVHRAKKKKAHPVKPVAVQYPAPKHVEQHGALVQPLAPRPAPPAAPVVGATPAVSTPLSAAPASAPQPDPVQAQQPPSVTGQAHGNGEAPGQGKDHGHGKSATPDASQPAPAPPAPVVPPVAPVPDPSPAPDQPQPGDHGNGHDHADGGDHGNAGDHGHGGRG